LSYANTHGLIMKPFLRQGTTAKLLNSLGGSKVASREFSAKPYLKMYKGDADMDAHRKEMYKHPQLFEELDQIYTQHFSPIKNGTELRIAYKNPALKEQCNQVIREYCTESGISFEEGVSYSRNQSKMSARTYTRKNCPGGEETMDNIHHAALTDCAFSTNKFGPTLGDYNTKYDGDPKKMAEATKRHRSDEDMSKMLNREVDTSGTLKQAQVIEPEAELSTTPRPSRP